MLLCAVQVLHGKAHFQTLHSKLGIAASSAVVLVAAGGLVSFRKLGLLQRMPDLLQAPVKTMHRNVRPRTCNL